VTKPSNGFQLGSDVQRPHPPSGKPTASGSGSPVKKPTSSGNAIGKHPNVGSNNTSNKRPNVGNNNTVNKNNINKNNVNVNKKNVNVNNNNVNINRNTNVAISSRYNNRAVVVNPVYATGGAWGWNHGSPWYPAPNYWGGGFWGAMAIGVTSAAVYGSIVSSANHQTYTSYQAQPNSPGSTLLSNYGLQQVQCGPSGLVVMYGPSNSVICANPNGQVAAGEYDIDSQTLSLVSR
jgi:Family of unknown function (DUF6515)